VADVSDQFCLPDVDQRAVKGLKFGEALPPRLAQATLATRFADLEGARAVLEELIRFVTLTPS
jgi:ATP-dependent Lhr-like helicase